MNRLALRLIRAGGVRPGLLLVSSAVGMLILLAALATPHAHDRQVYRQAARSDPRPYTGPLDHLIWQFDERLPIAGHLLERASVASTGRGAPAPLGASRVPRPGEVFVSPALARALRGPDGTLLRDALPGRVDGGLSDAILSQPGELVYMVGYPASELALTSDFPRARAVRGFVPRDLAAVSGQGFVYRVGFAVLIAAALVTITLVIANAARVGARRREARMSALRLVGADSHQVARIIATEAAITSLPGALLGALIALVLRSAVESWPFGVSPILSHDLTMPAWELALALAALPVIAFTSALYAMRGAAIDPLGVRRSRPAPRPRALSLLVPLAGWVILLGAVEAGSGLPEQQRELVAVIGTCTAAAGIALSGPWLAARSADLGHRLARGPAVLLGSRGLQADPSTSFRAVASLVLGLFVVSLSLTYFAAQLSVGPTAAPPSRAETTRLTVYSAYAPQLLGPALARSLRAIPGVRQARLVGGQYQPTRRIVVTTDGRPSALSRIVATSERVNPNLEVSPGGLYDFGSVGSSSALERTLLDDSQTLLWILDALAAASLAVAAIDGIGDRRRTLAALTAIGVPAGTLRRALAIEILVPFSVAAVTAAALGVVFGETLAALTSHASASIPWSTLIRWLGIAGVAALAATIATATRVGAAIRPEHLRSE
ncbi:MAG: FtsX-like permease family protein [Gaiellales bacterium]